MKNKLFRKLIYSGSALLTAAMLLCMAGCSGSSKTEKETKTAKQTEAVTVPVTEAIQTKTEETQKETEAAQTEAEETQKETEAAQTEAEETQKKTEAAQTETEETGTQTAASADTKGQKYLTVFEEAKKDTVKAYIEVLLQVEPDMGLVDMEMKEGYLDGFDQEITGFTACTKFSPMIGSIPFVGYVFQSEDPEALLKELTENANTAWNICTEADETVSAIEGSFVFFLMCSNEE